ncbi:hypothetical protein CUMW_172410 [Citrus unshiu]|uniref:Uncharacterized protein n=1 Tax=Citrus unshiu TaxID=55188 RepID=A0A2H5PVZ3_CITUN|nr:hypothetical protein CUMW_172410 [Citrus unshiu]
MAKGVCVSMDRMMDSRKVDPNQARVINEVLESFYNSSEAMVNRTKTKGEDPYWEYDWLYNYPGSWKISRYAITPLSSNKSIPTKKSLIKWIEGFLVGILPIFLLLAELL